MVVYYVQRYRWWNCDWIRISPYFADKQSAIVYMQANYDSKYSRDSYRIKEGV